MIIEFGDEISREINTVVLKTYEALDQLDLPGVIEYVPAYASLMIVYDPEVTSLDQIGKRLKGLTIKEKRRKASIVMIPICYDESLALDKKEFLRRSGQQWEEIIKLHEGIEYQVYMMGFLPGFLYMGEVDQRIQISRKKVPRKKIPKGSVGIADAQTGIYPVESPGGWNIIGQSPIAFFSTEGKFPIRAGDRVQFFAISKKDYEVISTDKNYQLERVNANAK